MFPYVIERTDYIHARVGCAISPQITDPGAPEWKDAVDAHIRWWEKIAEQHKKNHAEYLPMFPEFGPPQYIGDLALYRKTRCRCVGDKLLHEGYA